MTTPEFSPMTVVELRVDAFKRIEAATVHPTATGLVPVRGKNGAGKSSLIESMIVALGGTRHAPAMPINSEHDRAEILLDLGTLRIKRTWKRDADGKARASLIVTDSGGRSHKSPQAVLDALVGHFADPVAFLALTPADQVKTVLAVTGLDAELDSLEGVERLAVEQRRDVKRDHKQRAAAVDVLAAEVAELPPVPDVDVEGLSSQLREANARNAIRAQKIAALEKNEERGKMRAQQVERTRARISDLEDDLREARRELEEWEDGVKRSREEWASLNADVESLPAIEVAPIEAQLAEARDTSGSQAKRDLLAVEIERCEELAAAVETCETEVEEARGAIAELLDSVSFPVEGMSYDAETKTLTLNGIPFDQASQGQRLVAAASVAMAGDPKIRVMFVREGSLLDDDALALLSETVSAHGFQLWIERVDSHREGAGIYIEDGMAFETPVDEPTTATATTEEN